MIRDYPYLVQRMKFGAQSERVGIDAFFSYDYMGSAEFEFGGLGKALRELRAKLKPEWQPVKVSYRKYVAWYVGADERLPAVWEWFADRLENKHGTQRMKEPPYLYDTFVEPQRDDGLWVRDGWFCIDEGRAFGLFRELEYAERFLDGLRNPPKKAATP